MIRAYHHSGDRFYRLEFPLAELGNALAVCGWLMANQLEPVEPTTADEIRCELDRLHAQESLAIPTDGWFRRFAMVSRRDAPTGSRRAADMFAFGPNTRPISAEDAAGCEAVGLTLANMRAQERAAQVA